MNIGRIALKDGSLTVALYKAQAKKVAEATEVCDMIATLHPVEFKLHEAAETAAANLRKITGFCTTVEPPRPLLAAMEQADAAELDAAIQAAAPPTTEDVVIEEAA